MAKIIVQADGSAPEPDRMTLSERVVAAHLDDNHYRAQLLQRLSWAAADAEALESGRDRRAGAKPRGGGRH
jgi:hypothetical protein